VHPERTGILGCTVNMRLYYGYVNSIYREWKYNGSCKAYTKGMHDEAYGAAF